MLLSKDIESLDVHSKEILEKVMQYMEEKYIALPFKASKNLCSIKIPSLIYTYACMLYGFI